MGNGVSVEEAVNETGEDISSQHELIEKINEMFTLIRTQFEDDMKAIKDSVVIMKSENLLFQHTKRNDIAEVVKLVTGQVEGMANSPSPKSKAPEEFTDLALKALILSSNGLALSGMAKLVGTLLPSLGTTAETSMAQSTDMRLIDGNLFLYNAAFAYKFELKQNFKTTTMVAIGYFTNIFQSPRFVDNFVQLRKGLGVLKSYNENERAYHNLQKYNNETMAEMMKAKGEQLAELKDTYKLHSKLLVQAKHAMNGTEAPPFELD